MERFHIDPSLGGIKALAESTHLYVTTEEELDNFRFAAKTNYGPGIDLEMIDLFPSDWFVDPSVIDHYLAAMKKLQAYILEIYPDVFSADIDAISREFEMTCTTTICLFMIFMFRHLSTQFYKELSVVMVFLIYEFDLIGEKIFVQDCDALRGKFFLSDREDANVLPEIMNLFVIEGFKKCVEDKTLFLGPKLLEILRPGSTYNNRLLMVCKFLGEWLYHFNFTEYVVQFYTGDNLGGMQFFP